MHIGSNVYAELTAHTEIVQYKIFGIAEPILVKMNVSEQSASSLSPSELESLKMLVDINTPTKQQTSLPPVPEQTQTCSTSLVHEQMTGTTKMTITKSSANKVIRVVETQTTSKVDEPVPSTSRASDPSKACTVKITKWHKAVTTKPNREEQPKTDTDSQSASVLPDLKLTPELTSDEINKILKGQPSICLLSSKQKPSETNTAIAKTSDCCIEKRHNQMPEPERKLPARAVKRQPPNESKSTKDSAKRYKFKIDQHKLKRKYRHKYYFKCAMKECNCKFESV